ncbi:MAG: D-2-hydroxyacid dehydrogenase [Caldilineaceae bacterium]
MTTILLAFDEGVITAQQQAQLRQLVPDDKLVQTTDEAKIQHLLDEIEIAVGQFPKDLLPSAKRLRWFQQWSAGADWLLEHPDVQQMDFILTNASGVHATPISEHIFAFLLAFARNLPQAWQAQQEHIWMEENDGDGEERSKNGQAKNITTYSRNDVFELAGKSMLLIGLGDIGERTAQIATAFGMGVIGLRHNPDQETPGVAQMVGPDELFTVLPHADIVVSTVPLTEETQHFLGQQAFDTMKQGAYLINIGRGGTIDEAALIAALQSGKLVGAGLDVFEEEPLPADSPLWEMKNVIITPHSSGATPH